MRSAATRHFGPFAFDGTEDSLWCGADRCKLTANAGAVLHTRSPIPAAGWLDVHVSDLVLTT